MEHYERISPGAANRIIRMAEDSARAQNETMVTVAKAESRSVLIASSLVSFTPIALGICAAVTAATGHETVAITTAIGAVVTAGPKLIEAIKARPPQE